MFFQTELFAQWDKNKDCTLIRECNLKDYMTIKLNVVAPLLKIHTIAALKQVLIDLHRHKLVYAILGKGSNVVCTNGDILYIVLEFDLDKNIFQAWKETYILPASCPLSLLTSAAIKLGIGGWEVFTGIPATIGGAVVMNAGTNLGEIGPLIRRVWTVGPQGELKEYDLTEKDFSYRKNHFLHPGEVIYQVEIGHFGHDSQQKERIQSYLRQRKVGQPLDKATCGCVFKNVKGEQTCLAGKFIDIMGLDGLGLHSLKVSHRHANFIEHTGEATYEDFRNLVKFLQDELYLNYGVYFETEFIELG